MTVSAAAALRVAALDRDEARDLARRELSKPSYDRDDPLVTRALRWIAEQLERILETAAGAVSSGVGAVVAIAAVLVVAAAVILRARPLAARGRVDEPVLPVRRRSAAEHRAAADAAGRGGDWNTAVVERFRALVAGLEERGTLEARSARTAHEAAREASAVLPGLPARLDAAATLFAAVRYGGGVAGPEDDATLRRLDAEVAAARPARPANAPAELAAPR